MDLEVQVRKGKNPEINGGGGCITVWKYLIPQNYTLKNGYGRRFPVICISSQFKTHKLIKQQ